MITPLEELAEAVKTKPCPAEHPIWVSSSRCKICGEWQAGLAGTILNTEDPFFKTLWEPCKWCEGDGKKRVRKPGGMALAGAWYETEATEEPCSDCGGTGWQCRSRPEAVLLLLEVAQVEYGVTLTLYRYGECSVLLHTTNGSGGSGTIGDALAAAILTAKKAKKVANG